MNNPKIVISSDGEAIYVRFESIGSPSKFRALLYRFKPLFPFRQWDESTQSWRPPRDGLRRVEMFAERLFGRNSLVYLPYPITESSVRQPPLWPDAA